MRACRLRARLPCCHRQLGLINSASLSGQHLTFESGLRPFYFYNKELNFSGFWIVRPYDGDEGRSPLLKSLFVDDSVRIFYPMSLSAYLPKL